MASSTWARCCINRSSTVGIPSGRTPPSGLSSPCGAPAGLVLPLSNAALIFGNVVGCSRAIPRRSSRRCPLRLCFRDLAHGPPHVLPLTDRFHEPDCPVGLSISRSATTLGIRSRWPSTFPRSSSSAWSAAVRSSGRSPTHRSHLPCPFGLGTVRASSRHRRGVLRLGRGFPIPALSLCRRVPSSPCARSSPFCFRGLLCLG